MEEVGDVLREVGAEVMDWKLKATSPIGWSDSPAMVCTENHGCSMQRPKMPVYRETVAGRAIRKTRKSRQVTLRKAADILKMSAYDLSRIESGALEFEDEEHAKLAIKVLENT